MKRIILAIFLLTALASNASAFGFDWSQWSWGHRGGSNNSLTIILQGPQPWTTNQLFFGFESMNLL